MRQAQISDLPEAGERSAQVVWANAPMYGCRLAAPLDTAALSAANIRNYSIYLREPENLSDVTALHSITDSFRSGGYRLKQVFADTATYCMGD